MMRPAEAKNLREESMSIDARRARRRCFRVDGLGRAVLSGLMGCVLLSCGGDGQKDTQAQSSEAIRSDSKEVLAPAWSTNAAPPPKAGGIREIGSLPEDFLTAEAAKPVPVPSKAKEGPVDRSAATWTIAIGVFRGEKHFEEANQTLVRVRREGGIPDAYLQRRGPATVIAYGTYTGPADAKAQADLKRIQALEVSGTAPYAFAYLCPPFQAASAGPVGQYDLRRARDTYGASAMYTLQIGWYGREDLPRATEADLKEARKKAEEAVEGLRREGELAFFYHGPNRSMVTVGVFDTGDFDPIKQPGFESARLREAKRRHPLNLYNGAGYSYKAKGMREAKLLPSGLVNVPTK